MPQEPAYAASGGMDAGAPTPPRERRPRRAAANVRRWGVGSPSRCYFHPLIYRYPRRSMGTKSRSVSPE